MSVQSVERPCIHPLLNIWKQYTLYLQTKQQQQQQQQNHTQKTTSQPTNKQTDRQTKNKTEKAYI